jgi:D-alanyl-D-alanine dipeptidase
MDNLIKLSDIDPSILQFVRYATSYNFLGQRVKGYEATSEILLTRETALALKAVQTALQSQNYSLLLYDGFRPKEAVQNFVDWAKSPDISQKAFYYPTITDKSELFEKGYIAEESGHMKGNTVDLTIIDLSKEVINPIPSLRYLKNGEAFLYLNDNSLDMFTSFDLFHPASHHDSDLIDEACLANRNFLREIMKEHGFQEYQAEWWHYSFSPTSLDSVS